MMNLHSLRLQRREFIVASTGALGWLMLPRALQAAQAVAPANNPVTHLKLAWTDEIKWANVVDIAQIPGEDTLEKINAAQQQLAAKGGGVVYFPPGTYQVKDHIHLLDGIVLRGADPGPVSKAHDDKYAPPSKLEFPKFEFKAEGDGTPLDTAFKGIYAKDPATASNCGVVNLDVNRGHIHLAEAEGHKCGRNRIAYGCVLRNAARPDPAVPDLKLGQKPWQRYTVGYMNAAIDLIVETNGLIANNRLPKSGEDNFTMNGYLLWTRQREMKPLDGVVFDYDNRAGIYLNHYGIGGPGGGGPDGTPETHPWGFRKGLMIRDNYVFNTGRCAIGFCGDGVQCLNNIIRFPKGVWRPTVTGRHLSYGSDTNDNRAIEIRGWRWVVDGNDYEVYRNICADHTWPINDGEGLMHEDHVNSTVKDSVLTNNRGNAYLSIYQTAGVDGLLVEGNQIHIDAGAGGEGAITVAANRVNHAFPCRNVRILNNTVSGRGIMIDGSKEESSGNIIKGNKAVGKPFGKEGYVIRNMANAKVEDNEGFTVDNTPWMSPEERRKAREQKK
jgi:hypothetical protein